MVQAGRIPFVNFRTSSGDMFMSPEQMDSLHALYRGSWSTSQFCEDRESELNADTALPGNPELVSMGHGINMLQALAPDIHKSHAVQGEKVVDFSPEDLDWNSTLAQLPMDPALQLKLNPALSQQRS